MAEYVRRRYRTARFATSVALLGVLAGIGLGRGDDSLLEFDDAAAATRTRAPTPALDSISSKYIKNGSLLVKDFKSGELERKWRSLDRTRGYITEGQFPNRLVSEFGKSTPLLVGFFDDAFVGEGELDQKSADTFSKPDGVLRKHLDSTFVGEGELDLQTAGAAGKSDSVLGKYLDSTFVGEGELDQKSADTFSKPNGVLRKALDQNFVGQAGSTSTMPIPAQGASTAAFDSGTVQPGSDFKRKLVEITGMCSVSVTAAANSFDIEIANLSGETIGYSHTPIAGDFSIPTGGFIQAGNAGHIAQNAPFVTRTIQISSESGEDVPVATLTLSGRRGVDGALRVTTQLLVANP